MNLSDVLEEFDADRVKMGRLSMEDERVMHQIARTSGSRLLRMFGAGRYHVDLRQVGLRTSRPRTADGRETTIFRHSTVAKRRAREIPSDRIYLKAKDGGSMKSIAPSAGVRKDIHVCVEGKTGGWYVRQMRDIPDGMEVASVSEVSPRVAGDARGDSAARRQRYIERDVAVEKEPESGRRTSVGNIANTPRARTEFWRDVQGRERSNGRIQSAIIAELPYEPEVGIAGRRRIVENFGAMLDARGLRWHGVVHAPEEHSDARNFHMHIVYHDRPAEWITNNSHGMRSEGRWRFARKKLPETREYGFIRRLRKEFCDVVNLELERGGLSRRVDPRTYAEMGIAKKPGVHLGGAAHALERAGVVTTLGTRNVSAEIEYEVLELLSREQQLLESDRKAVEDALSAIEVITNIAIPVVEEKRQAVLRAATNFIETAIARARSDAHKAWLKERRDMMQRRPSDVAIRGRDPEGRDEAEEISSELEKWWQPLIEKAGREARRASGTLRRAKRILDRAVGEVLAEGMLVERTRVLEHLRDVCGKNTGGIGSQSGNLSRSVTVSRVWRSETMREEERLKAAEKQWTKNAAEARHLTAELGFTIGAKELKTRARRRRLRSLLLERGVSLGQDAPPGPAADLGRVLDRLNDVSTKVARLRGTLRLRKRAEAAADRPPGLRIDATKLKRRNQVSGGLRRRIDAIDHQIMANPTALSLVRKRGLEDRLFKDGEIARRKRKEPERGREG